MFVLNQQERAFLRRKWPGKGVRSIVRSWNRHYQEGQLPRPAPVRKTVVAAAFRELGLVPGQRPAAPDVANPPGVPDPPGVADADAEPQLEELQDLANERRDIDERIAVKGCELLVKVLLKKEEKQAELEELDRVEEEIQGY